MRGHLDWCRQRPDRGDADGTADGQGVGDVGCARPGRVRVPRTVRRRGGHGPEWSESTADLVDHEVARILREQEERTRALLTSHRGLGGPRCCLVEHETLDAEAVRAIVERRPATAVAEASAPRRLRPTRPV